MDASGMERESPRGCVDKKIELRCGEEREMKRDEVKMNDTRWSEMEQNELIVRGKQNI